MLIFCRERDERCLLMVYSVELKRRSIFNVFNDSMLVSSGIWQLVFLSMNSEDTLAVED